MAVSISKRRKLSHSPDPDREDSPPFASFSPAAAEEGTWEDGPEEDGDKLDGLEDAEDRAEEALVPTEAAARNRHTLKSARRSDAHRQTNGAPTTTDGAIAAAYTGGTFKSNVFKLQVDELLQNIRPRHGKREAAAEAALHKLKTCIEAIPSRPAMPVAEAERDLIKNLRVSVPFPDPRPAHDVKYKLEYTKPANVNVVGSYALKLGSKSSEMLTIDMLVVMPATIFQEKDYLNHRYFHKRAYYLACIAAGLRKTCADDYLVEFDTFRGNVLQPIIVVRPRQNHHERNWRINILPAVADKVFANEKMLPSKNCVRPAKSDVSDHVDAPLPATAFYNSTLQAERQSISYLKLMHSASSACAAYKDACSLGRVWLRQRGLSSSLGKAGFGNFEWAALIAVLLSSGGSSGSPALSTGYSSYQLFKATLQYLAAKDLAKQPAILQADSLKITSPDGSPILFDGTRSHNILYKMTPWSYKHLRADARATLSMLGDPLSDQFENTFILREDVALMKYDCLITVPLRSLQSSAIPDLEAVEICHKLHDTLVRGFGDRVAHITVTTAEPELWDVATARPLGGSKGDAVLGLIVNASNVNRAVDHGPLAENKKEAASFRKFWGEKAELRRFKDGSILESLVWSSKEGGPPIIMQITNHLLERHFGHSVSQSATFIGDALERLLRHSTATTPFQPLMAALKTLESDIRGMEDLPLTVRHLLAASPQLRYSSVEAPTAGTNQLMREPADVVIQFEGSGRWPDDLAAIQRTKIAFLLKLSETFGKTNTAITSRVGLENEETDILNQAFLDVIYATGAAFRLRIHHDREQTLIERQLKDKTTDPKSRETAGTALAAYKRDFIKAPALTQIVQKLCTRHPALSTTIRLTKKWFASHLLANHFPDELIELLAIHTFTRPWPWQTPSSTQTGFLRTLSFLSRWDWKVDPLLVDLGGDLKPADIQAMQTRFEAWRKLDPALNRVVLFAASSVDPEGTTWTDGAPAKVVAGRMSALARAAVQEVEGQALQLDPASLFASPLEDFDFVLHLDAAFAGGAKKAKAKTSQYKNLLVQDEADPERVGYRPAKMFLDELTALYGQAILFFQGGKTIAGLWSPHTVRRGWKVNLAYSTVPSLVRDEDGVVADVNKEDILGEIARLGGELVERIQVNR